jgi:LysM repeat protein/lysophospholipase L1-like esterase
MLNSSLLNLLLGIFLSGATPACSPVQEHKKDLASTAKGAISGFVPKPPDTLPALRPVEQSEYPFIRLEDNLIEQAELLQPFHQRLRDLENRKSAQVRILHIGDSHIQADLFTGWLRFLLQKRFGESGRGLVFPYRQAGSYNPQDLKTQASGSYEGRKSTFQQTNIPLGICGMGLRTYDPNFELELKAINRYGVDTRFNSVTLFHEKGENAFDWLVEVPGRGASPQAVLPTTPPVVERSPVPKTEPAKTQHKVRSGESLYSISRKYNCSVNALQQANGLANNLIHPGKLLLIPQLAKRSNSQSAPSRASRVNDSTMPVVYRSGVRIAGAADAGQPTHSVVYLDTLTQTLRLRAQKNNPEQQRSTLYGVLLENNEQPGVLYCAAGASGVTYYHFNQADYFVSQAAMLWPDLIVITLGTNESVQSAKSIEAMELQVSQLLTRLKLQVPQAPILLTINPDVLKNKSTENENGLLVRNILRRQAQQHGVATWDLFQIMGGMGSMRQWRAAGLAQSDAIHFSEKGYQVQAQLLYDALLKNYRR